MIEQDPLEEKFKSAFRNFKAAPSGRVWQGVSKELHPQPVSPGFIDRRVRMLSTWPRVYKIAGSVSIAAIILLLAAGYLFLGNQRSVGGHAYADETRLCRGTATLYSVGDKMKPYDSVKAYSTVNVDGDGYYFFNKVEQGQYMLLVVPELSSPHAQTHKPSWFDHQSGTGDAHIISVGKNDLMVDVHLKRK
jgi:hypothetical protein